MRPLLGLAIVAAAVNALAWGLHPENGLLLFGLGWSAGVFTSYLWIRRERRG